MIGRCEMSRRRHLGEQPFRSLRVTLLQYCLRLAHPHFRHQIALGTVRQEHVVRFGGLLPLPHLFERHAHGIQSIAPQLGLGMRRHEFAIGQRGFLFLVECIERFRLKKQRLVNVLSIRICRLQLGERLDRLGVLLPFASHGQRVLAPTKVQISILP